MNSDNKLSVYTFLLTYPVVFIEHLPDTCPAVTQAFRRIPLMLFLGVSEWVQESDYFGNTYFKATIYIIQRNYPYSIFHF
jgi:hypothetical protein